MWLELSPDACETHTKNQRECLSTHPQKLLTGLYLCDGDHLVGDSHLASGFRLGGESRRLPQSEPPEALVPREHVWDCRHPRGWLQVDHAKRAQRVCMWGRCGQTSPHERTL